MVIYRLLVRLSTRLKDANASQRQPLHSISLSRCVMSALLATRFTLLE